MSTIATRSGRKFSWFTVGLALLGVLVLGEAWCIYAQAQAAKKAHLQLAQKRRELASVSAIEPAPTRANAEAIEADLARSGRALAAMQASLRGRGRAAEALRSAPPPQRGTDAFFDIAAFVEKMRELAQRHGVGIKPDERFGFAEYANTGPEAELISAVFRERLILQHLLEALLEARPRQLVAVQREQPLTKAERAALATGPGARGAGRESASPDYFEIDPRVTARVPGFVDATAFRLTFVGQTAALRTFLNKLAGFELPLVVRSVEVEPASGADFTESNSEGKAATPVVPPLIRRTFSRFTVTVEQVDLAEPGT